MFECKTCFQFRTPHELAVHMVYLDRFLCFAACLSCNITCVFFLTPWIPVAGDGTLGFFVGRRPGGDSQARPRQDRVRRRGWWPNGATATEAERLKHNKFNIWGMDQNPTKKLQVNFSMFDLPGQAILGFNCPIFDPLPFFMQEVACASVQLVELPTFARLARGRRAPGTFWGSSSQLALAIRSHQLMRA